MSVTVIAEVRTARRSICPCGFAAIDESVPIGKSYRVHPGGREMTWICGGCLRRRPVWAVRVEPNGWMPVDVFLPEDGSEGEA